MVYHPRLTRALATMSRERFMSSIEIGELSGLSFQKVSWLLQDARGVEIKKFRHPDRNRYVKLYRLV